MPFDEEGGCSIVALGLGGARRMEEREDCLYGVEGGESAAILDWRRFGVSSAWYDNCCFASANSDDSDPFSFFNLSNSDFMSF